MGDEGLTKKCRICLSKQLYALFICDYILCLACYSMCAVLCLHEHMELSGLIILTSKLQEGQAGLRDMRQIRLDAGHDLAMLHSCDC